jgi:hypothetical protein
MQSQLGGLLISLMPVVTTVVTWFVWKTHTNNVSCVTNLVRMTLDT